MEMQRRKCSVRLFENEIEMIEKYPGKNFSEKLHALFIAQEVGMSKLEGDDLRGKYEIMLQQYLKCYAPSIWKEVDERRKELKLYVEVLEDIHALQDVTQRLTGNIEELCVFTSSFVEQKMRNCVVVRKKEREDKKNV